MHATFTAQHATQHATFTQRATQSPLHRVTAPADLPPFSLLQAEVFKRKRSSGGRAGAPYWQLANEKHRQAARAPGPLGRLFGFS